MPKLFRHGRLTSRVIPLVGLSLLLSAVSSVGAVVAAPQAAAADDCGGVGGATPVTYSNTLPYDSTMTYTLDLCETQSVADDMEAKADSLAGCVTTGGTLGGLAGALTGTVVGAPVGMSAAVGAIVIAGGCQSQAVTYKDAHHLLNKAVKECKEAGAGGVRFDLDIKMESLWSGWADLTKVNCYGGKAVDGTVRFNTTLLAGTPWSFTVSHEFGATYKYQLAFNADYTWGTSGDGQLWGTWSSDGTFEIHYGCQLKYTGTAFDFSTLTMSGTVESKQDVCSSSNGSWEAAKQVHS